MLTTLQRASNRLWNRLWESESAGEGWRGWGGALRHTVEGVWAWASLNQCPFCTDHGFMLVTLAIQQLTWLSLRKSQKHTE